MDTSSSAAEPRHDQGEPPILGEYAGYPVYPMPTFVALAATDLRRTVRFFTEALDFGVMFTGPEVHGVPLLVHLRRARYQDVLVRQAPGATRDDPTAALVVAWAAVDPAAVDALEARVRDTGGTIVEPAADTPWGTHDVTVVDPDGHRFTFTSRASGHMAPDIDRAMEAAAERFR